MAKQLKHTKKPKAGLIDAHSHPNWHGHDVSAFFANMDDFGIQKSWLLTWICPTDEYDASYHRSVSPIARANGGPISFEDCVRYKERSPDRIILGYAPDPRKPDSLDSMKAAVDIFGVQVCGELKLRMMYDNPDALRLYKFCGSKGIPVTVHIDYEFDRPHNYPRPNFWYGGGIGAFERAIAACPDTAFLGHAPGFWAHLSGDDKFDKEPYPSGPILPGGKAVDLFRRHPNLYGDMSANSCLKALQRDLAFTKDFIIEFQDRLLYARDCFNNDHQEFFRSLKLTKSVEEKIFRLNAERLTGSTGSK